MTEERTEAQRVRIAYKISAKGIFQPDITAEAETVETAMNLLEDAYARVQDFAKKQGTAE